MQTFFQNGDEHINCDGGPDLGAHGVGRRAGACCLFACLIFAMLLSREASAQTILLSEGFEGAFSPPWSIGDSNPTNGLFYWRDVNNSVGSVSAHTGSWKGYCAGYSNGVAITPSTYSNYMQAYMSQGINLSGYTGANLGFWYNIPSIETGWDFLRVYVDGTLAWSTSLSTADWTYLTLPLTAYVGGTHTLRFEFDSDSIYTYEGAYLDDIVVGAANQPFITSLESLQNANYTGYVLNSDATYGRSNLLAQATFSVENFTGAAASYTNVLSFRLLNASSGAAHPIYNPANITTNAGYTYNVTNVLALASGTNQTVTVSAPLRPAAWMSQFTNYYLECRLLTNGVLAQTLTTAPTNYYHFTNTVAGDPAYNALLNLTNSSWSRTYAVQTIPGQDSFQVGVGYEIRRWDEIGLGSGVTNIPVVFNYTLRDAAGHSIPLVRSSSVFNDAVTNYYSIFYFLPYVHTVNYPVVATVSHTLNVTPAAQLDSVNTNYYLTVTVSHTNNPASGQVIAANTRGTSTNELLHFSGNLLFGSVVTILDSLGVVPPVNPPIGGVIPTTLNTVSGHVAGMPGFTFAGAGPFGVNLKTNGDAVVTAGSVVLSAPVPDNDSLARVNFRRGPITLSSSGASADLRVTLPTGLGYRYDLNSLVVQSAFTVTTVPLSGTLEPLVDQTFMPGMIYAVEENKPVWMQTDRIIWHVAAGTFDLPRVAGSPPIYVRAEAYNYLQSVAAILVNPAMADKRSNDKYWMAVNDTGSDAFVRPDSGSNALLSVKFLFGPGQFRSHFPYDTLVKWLGGGSMDVTDDLPNAGVASSLAVPANVAVSYTRDCPDCGGAGGGNGTATIVPAGDFSFTRDGGLVAYGPTTAAVNLRWGYIGSPTFNYAQQALAFSEAGFHMPGVFLRGDQNSLIEPQRPTTILYSGVMATNVTQIERPMKAGYKQGLADYGGLNFRCFVDAAHGGRSTIAGKTNINWQLDYRSKYYIRPGGVSGIHEAVTNSFPASLTLWGYSFNFENYELSYLDSLNKDSVTDGSITLPSPANFTQDFEHMTFSCLGAPEDADLPRANPFKMMEYWTADFKTLSISFNSPDSCDVTAGYLVLGIEGYASHVDKPLFGSIGFFSSGDQIPPSFGLSGVTSRLKLPTVITLDGPSDSTYSFSPVQDAYYNTWSNSPPSPTAGWINIFGKMDVPFFEDMQLQLQTSCRTNGVVASNAVIYLSGGWPRAGTTNANYGWLDSFNRTPFETNLFDAKNLGWPGTGGGLTIANYRDNSAGEQYHPRAQRLWLGIIDFDYPLTWNSSLTSFKSWQQIQDKLLIVDVQHEIKYMDGTRAEIDFGAQYDGLPQISIANLAFNAIDEATGVGKALVESATQPVKDVLSAGLDEMDKLINTEMSKLMDGVFDRTVDPIIDQFYLQISNEWSGLTVSQRLQFVQNVQTNTLNFFVGTGPLSPSLTPLTSALQDLGNAASSASNLLGQIRGYLRDATNAINSVVGTINTTTNGVAIGGEVTGLICKVGGERPVVPQLMGSLVQQIAPQFIDALIGPTVSNLLQEVEPQLTEISSALTQTRDAITQVDSQLAAAGEFTAEINNALAAANSQLSNVSAQVSISVTQYFAGFDFHIDDPFQSVSAADLKQMIRQKIEDEFFATEVAAKIQTAVRQRVYDLDAAMTTQIDSVFQQVNDMLRSLISQSLAEVDNSINKCLGDVSDVMGAGQISGHALINGDSLKELRIDGHFQFKAPDNIELNAFLQIKELDSDGSAGCSSTAGPFTEVTIGATEVPMDWISPDLTANLQAKFTFDGTTPLPVNLAGELELVGDLNFEAFTLHDLAAALAFGKYENYLALKGGVKFNGYDFSGAVFFGKTCSLDPLLLIDPDVAGVLGNPPFTGAYCYAQGWLPVSEMVLGVPASCMFTISAGVGAGAFYFAEGPTYGGKMFLGVSGELLCIVSITGDITMIGVKQGDDLRFNGHGHFSAEVGSCPFCFSVSKNVNIKYINKSWKFD